MTYQEFKKTYNGKYVDYDGQHGSQCWDLAEFYITKCLGLPASILAGCDLVSNMLYPPFRKKLDKYFEEIPLSEAKAGDLAIWEYGHIAIFDHKDNYYFSQNPNPCKVIQINTKGVHIFALKGSEPIPKITEPVARDENKNQIEVLISNLNVRIGAGTAYTSLGYAKKGIYNFTDTKEDNGYKWYKIADSQWIAYNNEWEKVYLIENYFVSNQKYKTIYAKYLRTNPSIGNNIVRYKDLYPVSIKKKFNNINGKAQMKANEEIEPEHIVKEANGRIWGSYGNCYIVLQNVDGEKQAVKIN